MANFLTGLCLNFLPSLTVTAPACLGVSLLRNDLVILGRRSNGLRCPFFLSVVKTSFLRL